MAVIYVPQDPRQKMLESITQGLAQAFVVHKLREADNAKMQQMMDLAQKAQEGGPIASNALAAMQAAAGTMRLPQNRATAERIIEGFRQDRNFNAAQARADRTDARERYQFGVTQKRLAKNAADADKRFAITNQERQQFHQDTMNMEQTRVHLAEQSKALEQWRAQSTALMEKNNAAQKAWLAQKTAAEEKGLIFTEPPPAPIELPPMPEEASPAQPTKGGGPTNQGQVPLNRTILLDGKERMAPGAVPRVAGTFDPQNLPQNLTGQQYISALAASPAGASYAKAVQAVGDYKRAPPPTGGFGGIQSRSWTNTFMAAVERYNPQYNQQEWDSRLDARKQVAKEYAPGGKIATTFASAGTLAQHLDILLKAQHALHAGDSRSLQSFVNFIRNQTGDSSVVDFNTAKQAVIEEAERVYRGTGGSTGDISQWGANFNANASDAQAEGAVRTLQDLVFGRLTPLVGQYNQFMHTNKTVGDFLDPRSNAIWKRLQGGSKVPRKMSPAEKKSAGTLTDKVPEKIRTKVIEVLQDYQDGRISADQAKVKLKALGLTDAQPSGANNPGTDGSLPSGAAAVPLGVPPAAGVQP